MKKRVNFFLPLMFLLMLVFFYAGSGMFYGDSCTYNDYEKMVESQSVSSVVIVPNAETPTGRLTLHTKEGKTISLNVVDVNMEMERLQDAGITVEVGSLQRENRLLTIVLPILCGIVLIGMIFLMLNNQAMQSSGGGNRMMNFGKSRARRDDGKHPVTFKDVAGLSEEKEDLE